jgi:hypothetical protein
MTCPDQSCGKNIALSITKGLTWSINANGFEQHLHLNHKTDTLIKQEKDVAKKKKKQAADKKKKQAKKIRSKIFISTPHIH